MNYETNIDYKSSKSFIVDRSKRVRWVDTARGIGIAFVILGHLIKGGSSISLWIFSFHIPLFFFISGYLSKISERTAWESLKKIFTYLIIPYFIFVLLGLFVSIAIPSWRPVSYDKVLHEIFYTFQPESLHVGQIWFLMCLAIAEILFLLFIKISKNNIYILSVAAISLLISYIFHINNSGPISETDLHRIPWKIDSAFMGLFFFILGYLSRLKGVVNKIISVSIIKIALGLTVAFIVGVFISIRLNIPVNLGANTYGNLAYYVISSISGILFVIYTSELIRKNSLMVYLGRNALFIFSIHSFFLYGYAYILSFIFQKNFLIMTNIPVYLSFAGVFVVTPMLVFISLICNNFFARFSVFLKLKNI